MAATPRRGGLLIVELLRLGIVLLMTGAGFAVGGALASTETLGDDDSARLVSSVLGALVGYVAGGFVGRAVVRSVDDAQRRLQRVDSVVLIAASLGAAVGGLVGVVLLSPVVLLPFKQYTVPVALLIVIVLAYAGGRIGAGRAGELSRFVGVRGRFEVRSPSRGSGTKLVDSSALMDARLVEVARAGFLEGTLVVPQFVLDEVRGQADAEDPRRRRIARRGLDALKALQDEALVGVESSDDQVAAFTEVDAKLAALCRERNASLLTVDANLARTAEVGGVRVLNLHQLSEALRPPVVPGERLQLEILRPGRERDQGVGYLADGTMVVVERAAGSVGGSLEVDVTSIVQSGQGRLLFATPSDDA